MAPICDGSFKIAVSFLNAKIWVALIEFEEPFLHTNK